ncbi:hypothetical protein [Nonomuraea sp. NPDC049695]|uniref:hypothetical protein n=1 Tax=Nonomuraea sp. NPDC049695 TaxID=3154734 RepID=UPI00343D32DE
MTEISATTFTEAQTPYVVPQENGNRLRLTVPEGSLRIEAAVRPRAQCRAAHTRLVLDLAGEGV